MLRKTLVALASWAGAAWHAPAVLLVWLAGQVLQDGIPPGVDGWVQTGGTLGLSFFAIWMLNQVWRARLAAETSHSQEIRAMWEMTQKALNRNTRAVTRLCLRLGEVDADEE